jgi:hypothetical protein
MQRSAGQRRYSGVVGPTIVGHRFAGSAPITINDTMKTGKPTKGGHSSPRLGWGRPISFCHT